MTKVVGTLDLIQSLSGADPAAGYSRINTGVHSNGQLSTRLPSGISSVGWNYLGEWASGTTYVLNDVVWLVSNLWICIAASSTNQTPASNPLVWALVGLVNPMTAADDIIVGGAAGVPAALAKGGNSRVFGVNAAGVLGYRQVDTPDLVANAITRAVAGVGGPSVTQAWSTAGDTDVNQLTVTFTATAGSVWLIAINSNAYHSVTNGNFQLGLKINGTVYTRSEMYTAVGGSLGNADYQTFLITNTLGAVSVTFKVFAARVTAGTVTFLANTNGLTVVEYKR
jgi:hypothetical protein